MVKAQEWLDKKYPKEERSKVEEIYLNEPSLAGELDLGDFAYEQYESGIKVYISPSVDETKLTFKNKPRNSEIIFQNPQKYLLQKYLTKEQRERETYLSIGYINLEGELDLYDFINLKDLTCYGNKITSLNLNNCFKLKQICCDSNQLTSLDFSNCSHLEFLRCGRNELINLILPIDPTNLKTLWLETNNFPSQDLSFLIPYTNLESLGLDDNKFTDSLDYLSRMKNLKSLDISNTDLNEVNIDKLPKSLESLLYSTDNRPDCKLTKIVPQLDVWTWKDLHSDFTLENRRGWEKQGFNKGQAKEWIQAGVEPQDYCFVSYLRDIKNLIPQEFLVDKDKANYQEIKERCNNFDWCRNCQQPNTSKNWCNPCFEKELRQDLEQLTGQELVEKFIQQQQLRENNKDRVIKWIPYEQFSDIEEIAKGGFGKIYKAKWEAKSEDCYPDYSNIVVLKVLNNSQNITSEFLKEVINIKLVDAVPFYGISQDPITKNYIMIMSYMKDGNLRQYLQQESNELDLERKLYNLWNIVGGLRGIHNQNLVHRDFHSGNILNSKSSRHWCSYVADLGLSQPANYQKEEGKIFGVLPYVAPEVIQGQPYTKASDIYGFGIIAYELLANNYPYYEPEFENLSELQLSLKICRGSRPNIDKIKIPQGLKDLIKRCWDADPQKRPNAEELWKITSDWNDEIGSRSKKNTEFYQQYLEIAAEYNSWSKNAHYQIHPVAITTSKFINTKQITQQLEKLKINEQLGQDSKQVDLEISETITEIAENEEQTSLQTQIEQPPKQ